MSGGSTGVVVSDWGAVHDRVAALRAGLDLEMPPNLGVSDAALVAAVESGELDEAVLDLAVTRLLRLVDRARPALAEGGTFDEGEHHALARRAAAESAVLLKNDGGVLPLEAGRGRKVAVIGEFARTPRYQGAGSSQVNPTRLDLPLEELRAALGEGVDVRFAAGFAIVEGEEDAERGAARRRRSRWPVSATTSWCSSALPAEARVRRLRPDPHQAARQPAELG